MEGKIIEQKTVVWIMGCVLVHSSVRIQDVGHGYIVSVLIEQQFELKN